MGVEREVAAHHFPNVSISRERFAEGGLLSDKRIFIRGMRERFCIDTCAAPFGDVFYFTIRTVHVPARIRLWHLLATLGFCFLVESALTGLLGWNFACIALAGLVVAVVLVMRQAASGDFSDLDSILLGIPALGTIYEEWFRIETYYREDTRKLYLQILPEIILKHIQEVCATQGVRLVTEGQPTPPEADLNPSSKPTKESAGK